MSKQPATATTTTVTTPPPAGGHPFSRTQPAPQLVPFVRRPPRSRDGQPNVRSPGRWTRVDNLLNSRHPTFSSCCHLDPLPLSNSHFLTCDCSGRLAAAAGRGVMVVEGSRMQVADGERVT